jgi:glycosyltransferase involved in cell wall biosynthesis
MPTLFQINTIVNTGSTGRIAEDIGIVTINNGWNSYIAYGRGSANSQSHLYKIGTFFDVILHGIISRIFDLHGFGSILSTKRLIKKIKVINPDIIQLHNLHGYYINIKILFNFLNTYNKPVFLTFHDCWPITGHCTHFEYVKCEKWKTQCNQCPQLDNYPKSYFFDNSKNNFINKRKLFLNNQKLHLIFVSEWLKDISKNSFLSKNISTLIYNGINLELFYPRDKKAYIKNKYCLGNEFLILGVASVWSHRKGLSDFLKLSKILPDFFKIILVGLSKQQLSTIPSNIIGIEKTENIAELADLYSTSDVFLNLTLEDNFPTTNLEALACGTPVVTYNTGGCSESIDHNTGYVIEQGNLNGVVEILQELYVLDKAIFKNNCRNRAINLFDNKIKFNEYFNLYKSALIL